jgi:hypothetical protein
MWQPSGPPPPSGCELGHAAYRSASEPRSVSAAFPAHFYCGSGPRAVRCCNTLAVDTPPACSRAAPTGAPQVGVLVTDDGLLVLEQLPSAFDQRGGPACQALVGEQQGGDGQFEARLSEHMQLINRWRAGELVNSKVGIKVVRGLPTADQRS